jgi:hypothetical protein
MPSRIPIKIFRLQQTSKVIPDNAPTRFAQGVTTEDIITNPDGNRYINLQQTPSNFIGPVQLTKVESDDVGSFVWLDGAQKLYIKSPNVLNTDKIDQVFEFYVNPQRLSPTYTKIVSEIRTRGGWEIQHWGDALTELRVEGKSGGMHRKAKQPRINRNTTTTELVNTSKQNQQNGGDGLRGGEDVTDTEAWRKLLQLKQLYDVDHATRNQEQLTLLGIAVYNTFYVGYFTSFTGPEYDANEPYQFSYSFTMKILYETNVSTFNPTVKNAVTAGTTFPFKVTNK